jgi:hypothetical protein
MMSIRHAAAAGGLALIAASCFTLSAHAEGNKKPQLRWPNHEKVQLALIGDVPYRDVDILKLDQVIRDIN